MEPHNHTDVSIQLYAVQGINFNVIKENDATQGIYYKQWVMLQRLHIFLPLYESIHGYMGTKCREMCAHTKSVKMLYHYTNVITSIMASQITGMSIVSPGTEPFVRVQIKENIKATHNFPLWSEYTSDWWILHPKGQLQAKWFNSMTLSWYYCH